MTGKRSEDMTPAERFDAAWDMSNELAGGFDDVPTTTGDPPRVVAPPVKPAEAPPEGD